MVSLRKFRMKCFKRKPLEIQNAIKSDYYSRLLLDVKVDLDLNDEEFHNLCGILAERCPFDIFNGGKIDNLSDYVVNLDCRFPQKALEKSRQLSISIDRVQKESSFPFNLNELFIEYANFKVSFLNKDTKVCESEVLFAPFDYLPEYMCKQTYIDEEDLDTFEYWLSSVVESSILEFSIFCYKKILVRLIIFILI